jgi:asparagine synthase (glutamine-hydrolysing)
MDTGSAVVFGAVSIHGAPLPPVPSDAEEVSRSPRACLFRRGASDELHVLREDRWAVVVLGRVWQPVSINPGASAASLRPLAGAEPADLHGSFALVRMDGNRLRLHTDRYGLRPLFYRRWGGLLLFATHVRGLAALAPLPGIDEEALLHYYNFSVTPNDRTLLAGVRKVPPGRLLCVGDDFREIEYFTPGGLIDRARFAACSEDALCREIDARLGRAVQRRIGSDEVVGIALSGGVDSGLLAAKAVRTGARVIGYTLAYGGAYDEFARVDFLARALSIDVRRITLAPADVIGNFEHASGVTSEPVGFNNATMRFAALAARADGVRTLFDGDGADRLFLGMTRYLRLARMMRSYDWLARVRLVPLACALLRILPWGETRKARLHLENRRRGIPLYPERRLGRPGPYEEAYERRVFELGVARHWEALAREGGGKDFGLFLSWLAIQMCPELFFHDPSELQDELSLFPAPGYWDDEIVSIALSLPTRWKLRHGRTKYILRETGARVLDAGYWKLPKVGLQSAYAFAVSTPDGDRWRRRRMGEARASREATALGALVPGPLDVERLLPLVVWKERHGLP